MFMNDDRINKEKAFLEKIKQIIVEERKNLREDLERIPKEYKGRYADVKWGDEDLVEDLSSMCESRLTVLDSLEKSPYFGSFDFKASDADLKRFRIGKTDIFDERKVEVLDWRNPICTLYYDKSIGPVSYLAPQGEINGDLINKQQIIIRDGELKSIRDVDLVSDDELLQPYLDVNVNNKMKNIIASIQSEQNGIIRQPMGKNLIVQGVAGSGKTSVALHRIAYLLYNRGKEVDANKFIVIGPNNYFLNYISSLLPDLGTSPVREITFEDIAKTIIQEDKFQIESSNEELNRHIKTKNNTRIKGSIIYKQALDRFLQDYFNEQLKNGIYFQNICIVNPDNLRSRFGCGNGYSNRIKEETSQLIKTLKNRWEDIYYGLNEPLIIEMKKYPLKSEERNRIIEQLDEFKELSKKGFANEIKSIVKPLLISPINLYKLFLENIDKYLDLSESDIKYLKNSSLTMLKKKIIPYEDLAALTYLSALYYGPKFTEKYKHVVIDEAQDYNVFQLLILKSLFRNSSFSIFGDLAQSIYSHRSISSWDEVKDQVFNGNCDILEMEKSYRTTKEITEVSNLVLDRLNLKDAKPVIRTGEEVETIFAPEEDKESIYIRQLTALLEKKYKSIGIICKNEEELNEVSRILDKHNIRYNTINNNDTEFKSGITLLTSYLAKGLEFDSVIINDASVDKYNSSSLVDMHLLYVALTRALHEMIILYETELCDVLENTKKHEQKLSLK